MQVKDYDAALDLELDSMEKFVLQCLAFYQVTFFSAWLISSDCLIGFMCVTIEHNYTVHVTNKFKIITNFVIYVLSIWLFPPCLFAKFSVSAMISK